MRKPVPNQYKCRKIFTKIMMPLSKPIITTVAIMAFIRSWSDLL